MPIGGADAPAMGIFGSRVGSSDEHGGEGGLFLGQLTKDGPGGALMTVRSAVAAASLASAPASGGPNLALVAERSGTKDLARDEYKDFACSVCLEPAMDIFGGEFDDFAEFENAPDDGEEEGGGGASEVGAAGVSGQTEDAEAARETCNSI